MKIFLFIIVAILIQPCQAYQPRSSSESHHIRDYGAPAANGSIYHKKVALVIGNSSYQNVHPLVNTINDATDMKVVLQKIGFEVIFKKNLNEQQMDKAIDTFENRLSKTKAVGFFYFAGHGVDVAGTNYLIPIDHKKINNEIDLKYNAIDVREVLEKMQLARDNVNIIVLDACRDNPLVTSRSMRRGLGKMTPPKGSIIAYATDVGKTADDFSKNGRNGLFTSHLIKALDKAYKWNRRIDDMFMEVSEAVMQESNERQEPWYLSSLKRPFYLRGSHTKNVVPQPNFYPGKVLQDRLKDGSLGPKMVVIPAGSFRMGDIQGGGYSDEQPVHKVSVRSFAMGMYEVTFSEYDKFAKATRRSKTNDRGWGRGNRPVINVSWYDATAYVKWLSNQTGKNYRLPTEAEWEYAARAGTDTKYWWGNNIYKSKANYYWNFGRTSSVGYFSANKFGLYDTLGNVWEWTCSEVTKTYNGKEEVCVRKNTHKNIILRGGSWGSSPNKLRAAYRLGNSPSNRLDDGGFRVVRIN